MGRRLSQVLAKARIRPKESRVSQKYKRNNDDINLYKSLEGLLPKQEGAVLETSRNPLLTKEQKSKKLFVDSTFID